MMVNNSSKVLNEEEWMVQPQFSNTNLRVSFSLKSISVKGYEGRRSLQKRQDLTQMGLLFQSKLIQRMLVLLNLLIPLKIVMEFSLMEKILFALFKLQTVCQYTSHTAQKCLWTCTCWLERTSLWYFRKRISINIRKWL